MSNENASSAQIRAARGLLGWSQTSLANGAGLALQTVMRFETGRGARVSADAVAKMAAALESAGVIFVEENGEGPGVRLRKEYPMWKQVRTDFPTYKTIFDKFRDLVIKNYSPDLGLFEMEDGDDYVLVLTPAAAKYCALLPGEWSDIQKPTSKGWAFLVGDGPQLSKRGLDLTSNS